jgi:hypothetical protein
MNIQEFQASQLSAMPHGAADNPQAALPAVDCIGIHSAIPKQRMTGVAGLAFLLLFCGSIFAQTTNVANTPEAIRQAAADRASKAFTDLRKAWTAAPTNAGVAWQFGRGAFEWAEFATNDDQRATIASDAIAACRRGVELSPTNGDAHYYLAMNLGQLARTKSLGALKLVKEMESCFKRAIALQSTVDHHGAHRSLGVLYFEAPGWPASIGSNKHAREYLQKAAELESAFPENRLCYIEALVDWKDVKLLEQELPAVTAVLAAARSQLGGEEWALSWLDWNSRWKQVQARAEAAGVNLSR